jgi:hypothetical protein
MIPLKQQTLFSPCLRLYQGWARINARVNVHAMFHDYIDALLSAN